MKKVLTAVFLLLSGTAQAADVNAEVKIEPWPVACVEKFFWDSNFEAGGYTTVWSKPSVTGEFLISYIESYKDHAWAVTATLAAMPYVCTLAVGFLDEEPI